MGINLKQVLTLKFMAPSLGRSFVGSMGDRLVIRKRTSLGCNVLTQTAYSVLVRCIKLSLWIINPLIVDLMWPCYPRGIHWWYSRIPSLFTSLTCHWLRFRLVVLMLTIIVLLLIEPKHKLIWVLPPLKLRMLQESLTDHSLYFALVGLMIIIGVLFWYYWQLRWHLSL